MLRELAQDPEALETFGDPLRAHLERLGGPDVARMQGSLSVATQSAAGGLTAIDAHHGALTLDGSSE